MDEVLCWRWWWSDRFGVNGRGLDFFFIEWHGMPVLCFLHIVVLWVLREDSTLDRECNTNGSRGDCHSIEDNDEKPKRAKNWKIKKKFFVSM